MQPLKIFLSYVSADKKLVGNLKGKLQDTYKFEVFVAHDDIVHSTQFDKSILETLRRIDLFIPVLTNNFHNSCFTNQEIGFVLALNKTVLPLKVESNPQGFISNYQAMVMKDIPETCNKIYSLLLTNIDFAHLRDLAINSLVLALQNSNNFDETNILIKQLRSIPKFSGEQILGIQQACNTNQQVSNRAYQVHQFKVALSKKYHISFAD